MLIDGQGCIYNVLANVLYTQHRLSCNTSHLFVENYMDPPLSRTTPGCVTRHTRHASVTHFRPILGNIVEVTLVTSPNLYINSHAKGTGFPLVRITIMIPP